MEVVGPTSYDFKNRMISRIGTWASRQRENRVRPVESLVDRKRREEHFRCYCRFCCGYFTAMSLGFLSEIICCIQCLLTFDGNLT